MTATKQAPQMKAVVAFMDYLQARWTDEREYEDWAGYQTAARLFIENEFPGAAFIRLGKRPFQLEFALGGSVYTVRVGKTITTFVREVTE